MKYLILLLLAAPVYAATTATVTVQPTFDLYQGSALVSPRVTRATFAECVEAGRLLNKGDGCQSRNGKFTRTTVADPPPVATGTLTLTPATLPAGGGVATAVWTCPGAATLKLNGQTISTASSGNMSGSVPVPSTVTLACGGQTLSRSITAEAPPPPPPPPPVGTGTASLRWSAPAVNTDGTPLTDLAGYRVYYGTSPAMNSMIPVSGTAHDFTGLVSGTHYFAVTAVNASGIESAKTETGSKVIQ